MEIANQSLKFHADGLAEDTLVVKKLRGEERLAGPFRFELELVSREAALDLDGLLYKPAKLGILQRLGQEEASFQWFQGVLQEIEQLEQQQKGQWTRYRAVIAPDLVRLEECWRSRVFQAMTTEELVGDVLKKSLGLQPGVDFEWSLTRQKPGDRKSRPVYPEREYVVQYAETDLDFVQRWLEQEGIWYQFDNDGTREKLLFADSSAGYKDVSPLGHRSYPYRPEGASRSTSGGEGKQDAEDVIAFSCQARRRPGKITLDDYNWRDPQVALTAEQVIHEKGSGVLREYNHHYKTPAQGATHAETRAQEWKARAAIYRGASTCRGFRPGRKFGLEEHYRGDWNRDYLLISVVHEAEQSINLEASNVTASDYKNSFECIPAELEFRPERTVSWPYIHGVMHARIDGEGDGQTADLDELGRYKVRIPWDENAAGAAPGKGSRRIRMSQPYAGPGSGLHFPLLQGTEVLLTHVDGDPDRPIISGAIPDADTQSPTNQDNPTQNKIQTPSGNMFVVDDHPDRSGFLLMDANRCFVQDFRCASSGAGVGGMSGGGGGEPGPSPDELNRKLEEIRGLRGEPAQQAELLREIGQAISRSQRPLEALIARSTQGDPSGGRGNEEPHAPSSSETYDPPKPTGDAAADAAALARHEARRDSTVAAFMARSATPMSGEDSMESLHNAALGFLGPRGASVQPSYQLDARRFGTLVKLYDGSQEILVSNVSTYHYTKNEIDVSISDGGGLSYAEAFGGNESTEIKHGEQKETVKVYGDQLSTTENQGGVSEKVITFGAQLNEEFSCDATTNVKFRLGTSQEFLFEAANTTGLYVNAATVEKVCLDFGGEISFNLSASARAHFDIIGGFDKEIRLCTGVHMRTWVASNLDITIPDETEVRLKKIETGLQATKLNVSMQSMKVTNLQNAVSDVDTRVSGVESGVKTVAAALDSSTTALNNQITAVSDKQLYVQNYSTGLAKQVTALDHSMTAVLHRLQ